MDEETNIPVIVFYYTFPRVVRVTLSGSMSSLQRMLIMSMTKDSLIKEGGERMSAIMERVGIGHIEAPAADAATFRERQHFRPDQLAQEQQYRVQNQHFQQYQLQQQFSQQNMRQWPGKYGQNVIPGPPLPSDLGNYDHITRKTEEWGLRGSENDIALSSDLPDFNAYGSDSQKIFGTGENSKEPKSPRCFRAT